MSPKQIIIAVLKEHSETLIGTATADGMDGQLVDAVAIAILLKLEGWIRVERAKVQPATLEGDMLMAALKGLSLTNANTERDTFFFELARRIKDREEKGAKS